MKLRMLCTAAVVGFGSVTAAQADTGWLGVTALGWEQTPGWFVGPGVSGGFQQLPRWNSTVSIHSPAAVGAPQIFNFSTSPELGGAEGGLTVGYAFRDGMLPPWFGTRVRVGLTGSWQSYSDNTASSGVTSATGAFQYIGVDGRVITALAAAGTPFTETLRVNRKGFDVNLRIASDFPLQPGWTLTPGVSVFGGRVRDTYNYRHTAFATPIVFDIDEKVKTTSFGGDVSAGLTWQATSYLALNATARGGVVWMRSRLEGSDCFGFGTVSCSPPFTLVGPSTGSVTDSRSRVGFRGGLSLGAALDMRFGILSIGGFFTYDSAIPGVSNPTSALATTTPGTIGAARIRFDDGFRYGGTLNLRIPLIWM
jgi:hypothetical protein